MNELYPIDEKQRSAIDRLAAGELGELPRRELFAWLDGEPQRWRHCAVALLEAREWELALNEWKPALPAAACRVATLPAASARSGRLRSTPFTHFIRWAALCIACGVGAVVQSLRSPAAPTDAPIAAEPASPQALHSDVATPAVAVASADETVPTPGQTTIGPSFSAADSPPAGREDGIPSYVRSVLERRGYRVGGRRDVVMVSLPDGGKVPLPVDQWQLRYVGQPSY